MLQARISAFFFLLCLTLFSIGAIFSLPPLAKEWKVELPGLGDSIRGKAALLLEAELEDKLAYKEETIDFWGSLRYELFKTGSKGVVVGKDDWLFTKEEFETTPEFQDNIAKNYQRIQLAIQKLKSHGIHSVMAWIPAKARLNADKLANKKQPVEHINLSPPSSIPLIDGSEVFTSFKDLAFMRTDTHWSQDAASAMAQAIAEHIRTHHKRLNLTTKSFTTISGKSQPYSGDLADFAPSFSFVGPTGTLNNGKESIQKYETNASSTEAKSLFGDEVLDVVLIGTSYSAQKEWHFEGFLKQALQMDILNLADEGEGPFAPMDAFLERLDKGEISAKFVIWEFPERYLPRATKQEEEGS